MSEQKRSLPPTSIDRSALQKTFTQRCQSGEFIVDLKNCTAVANRMLLEMNALSGRSLLLLHKIVEILRTEPRHLTEYLQ